MKLINIVFVILFIVAASLQYNDPDPYLWIPIYLYGAFLCYQAIKKKYIPILYIIGLCFYVGYALYLFFDNEGVISWAQEHGAENIAQTMKASKPYIEQTREFGGLVILILALVMNMIWLGRSHNRANVKMAKLKEK